VISLVRLKRRAECCKVRFWEFLGVFAKLRKPTISFMFVRLSAWNNSASTGRILMSFDIRFFLEKSAEKIKVSLKSEKDKW
jgi:hypothetical protein